MGISRLVVELREVLLEAVTGKAVTNAFKASYAHDFRYDHHTQEMVRTSDDVVPGISVREFKAQKIVKSINKAVGPSSYVVVVYTGVSGSRRISSDRLKSMRETVVFIKAHAKQAAAAVAAEEG